MISPAIACNQIVPHFSHWWKCGRDACPDSRSWPAGIRGTEFLAGLRGGRM